MTKHKAIALQLGKWRAFAVASASRFSLRLRENCAGGGVWEMTGIDWVSLVGCLVAMS